MSFNVNLPEKYVIKKEIGSGGMARVFLAEDRELGKYVAVKVLNLDPSTPTSNQQRFKEEMRLVQYIKSPYIVRFYEGKYDKNIKYLSMEYVQGKMLKEVIEMQGRLQPDRAVDYAIQIAKGFSEIHAQNIVHRDLKTSNVMITNTGQVKIIDFGIAISDDSSRFTQTGKVIGSVHYLAPELIDKQEASPQSDIYALGIILYEMLIGNPPHRGKTPIETALKHKTEPIPQVNKIYPNIPQALSNIVVKATAKKKELRYQSMRQLEADLADCLSQKRMTEKPIVLDDKPAIKRFGLFNRRK
ncbi:MAG: serine/threonine protein kinase [Mycoplasmataceae bacterium]|nr:serine/threonine protein kinase [Mycoplasmataceae bacterium]